MFEKYTEGARRVIFFARYEASQLGSSYIGTEHVLLGLMRESDGITGKIFSKSKLKLDMVRKEIEGRTVNSNKISTSIEIPLSPETKRVLVYAAEEAEKLLHKYIGTEHILLGLLREKKSLAARILAEKGMRFSTVREDLVYLLREKSEIEKKKEAPYLAEFSRDLTSLAFQGKLDPLINREKEMRRLIQILCRRTKNNPVLIGEPGVGKTAIIEGLAQKIVKNDVPEFLFDKRILALDISSVVAGTKYRGQFEERLKAILKELVENDNILVFIDELHTLVGAGSAEGSLDAAGILKPALSRGEIKCLGATTPKDYRRFIEKDRALERRFQSIKVHPTNEGETLKILKGIKDRYEHFHNIRYNMEALRSAVYLSSRYIPDRFQPDKSIDVMDEAGARAKLKAAQQELKARKEKESADSVAKLDGETFLKDLEKASISFQLQSRKAIKTGALTKTKKKTDQDITEVIKEEIEEVVADWTGIPLSSVREGELEKLLHMEDELHKRIVAQNEAITALCRAIRRSRAGLKNPNKPVGSFLFLGPTGVGKTEVARTLARYLFGSDRALIRFDMSEYMEKHSLSKLIGSPPGYVGYEEGGQLTDRVKQNPYSVVLLDEIEKAHPNIFNLLLQVFDDGRLTDGLGNLIDFKNCLIIMTSNLGARFIHKKGSFGFQTMDTEMNFHRMKNLVMIEVKKLFNPEFLNRLDEIIVFHQLSDDDLVNIIKLMIADVNLYLAESDLKIELHQSAYDWLIEKTCKDRSYGARPLRRAIQKYIEDVLAEEMIKGSFKGVKVLEVYLSADELAIREKKLQDIRTN
jgi:ATP-dependent Clp protease ATP-binding subunit ClpC